MKDSGMLMEWYGLLVGVPLLIAALMVKDWITTFTHKAPVPVHRMRKKGA